MIDCLSPADTMRAHERYFVVILGKNEKGYDSELVGWTEYRTPDDVRTRLKRDGL